MLWWLLSVSLACAMLTGIWTVWASLFDPPRYSISEEALLAEALTMAFLLLVCGSAVGLFLGL